jgi:hypothetical protein
VGEQRAAAAKRRRPFFVFTAFVPFSEQPYKFLVQMFGFSVDKDGIAALE